MSTATTNTVYSNQPSWSDKPLFWCTDYDTYLKIKKLRKWYWQTVYDVHKWARWDRKLNKPGPEPKYCPLFTEEGGMYVKKKHYDKETGLTHTGNVWFPVKLTDRGYLDLYQIVRMPHETKEDLIGTPIPDKALVDQHYAEASAFFE